MSKNQHGLTCKKTLQTVVISQIFEYSYYYALKVVQAYDDMLKGEKVVLLKNCGKILFRIIFSLCDVLIVRSAYSMCYVVIKQRQWCCGELMVYK